MRPLTVLLLCAILTGGSSQISCDPTQLQPDEDSEPGSQFGYSVALSSTETCACIGAPFDSRRGENAGAVYCTRNPLHIDHFFLIYAREPVPGAMCGTAIATVNNKAFVSCPGAEPPTGGSGITYVFEHSGSVWNEVQTLRPNRNTLGLLQSTILSASPGGVFMAAPVASEYVLHGFNEASVSGFDTEPIISTNQVGFRFRVTEPGLVLKELGFPALTELTPYGIRVRDDLTNAVIAQVEFTPLLGQGWRFEELEQEVALREGATYTIAVHNIDFLTGGIFIDPECAFDVVGVELVESLTCTECVSIGNPNASPFPDTPVSDCFVIDLGIMLSGSVKVLNNIDNTFVVTQRLAAPAADVDMTSEFPKDVQVNGNFAIVGAPEVANHGVAYVYRKDENTGLWMLEARLTAIQPLEGDEFGYDVSIREVGDDGLGNDAIAVVGAPGRHGIGSAYVYVHSIADGLWHAVADLNNCITENPVDRFGSSVGVTGDLVLVGSDVGSRICRFEQNRTGPNQWATTGPLVADNHIPGDKFGSVIMFLDDRLIVGASGDDSAYLYDSGQIVPTPDPTDVPTPSPTQPAPQLVATYPADGDIDIGLPLNAIMLQFDCPVERGFDAEINIHSVLTGRMRESLSVQEGDDIAINGNLVTISLLASTIHRTAEVYSVHIDANAFQSIGGLPLEGDLDWQFATESTMPEIYRHGSLDNVRVDTRINLPSTWDTTDDETLAQYRVDVENAVGARHSRINEMRIRDDDGSCPDSECPNGQRSMGLSFVFLASESDTMKSPMALADDLNMQLHNNDKETTIYEGDVAMYSSTDLSATALVTAAPSNLLPLYAIIILVVGGVIVLITVGYCTQKKRKKKTPIMDYRPIGRFGGTVDECCVESVVDYFPREDLQSAISAASSDHREHRKKNNFDSPNRISRSRSEMEVAH